MYDAERCTSSMRHSMQGVPVFSLKARRVNNNTEPSRQRVSGNGTQSVINRRTVDLLVHPTPNVFGARARTRIASSAKAPTPLDIASHANRPKLQTEVKGLLSGFISVFGTLCQLGICTEGGWAQDEGLGVPQGEGLH
jgi:hypothetical protein